MSKYIDAEKVIAEIERLYREHTTREYCDEAALVLEDLEDYIDSLQQERPPLPSNIDEAAEEYEDWAESYSQSDFPTCISFGQSFKAGAEWMARQFQKIEGNLVDWYSTGDGKDYCCGVKTDEAFEVPEGFYIRKKK